MKKILTYGFFVLIFLSSLVVNSQTPQYIFANNTTGGNNIPFGGGTWADQRNQWFYAPGDFGTNVNSGFITKIYFRSSGTYAATTWTNLKISLGQPNIMGLTSTFVTGLTLVYNVSSHTAPATVAYDWIEFVLQTPFLFDPTKPLVVETIQTGTSGGKALHAGGTPIDPAYSGNTQTYGASSATTGSTRRYSYACGITVVPAAGFDVQMSKIVSPVVFGVGYDTVTVEFRNNLADTVYWLDLGYQLGTNTPELIYNYTPTNPILAGQSHTYKFATPVYLPSAGSYDFKTWVADVNDQIPDDDPTNDTLFTTVCTGISGNFTIGSTGNYSSFAAALAAVKSCGVAGPIKFTVQAGSYNEYITLEQVSGMDAVNTITFDGISNTMVTLSSSGSTALDFNGGDYFIFKNMKINAGTYTVAWFHNNADFNKIENCIINGNTTSNSSSYNAIMMTSSVTSYTSYGMNGNFNEIRNCKINGGYCGVVINGSGTTSVVQGNKIIDCTFRDQYYYGIRSYYSNNNTIDGNDIADFRYASSYGIYSYYGQEHNINSNIIRPGCYGIYMGYENYYGGDSSQISNNFIYDFHSGPSSNPTRNESQHGIYMYYYNYRVNIYHNTIVADGKSNASTDAIIYIYYYPTGSKIMNNIFVSLDGTYFYYLYYPNSLSIDYNLYYYPNNAKNKYDLFYCYTPASYYKDLKTFKTFTAYMGGHDYNSWDNIDPGFVSMTDPHLSKTTKGFVGPKFGMTKDVDGDPRCKYGTAIGADESNYPVPKPVAGFYADDTVCTGSPIKIPNLNSPTSNIGNWWFVDNKLESQAHDLFYTFTGGTNTITLITENCGGSDTATKTVFSGPATNKPIADFIAMENLVEVLYPIQVFDFSTNCPEGWEWSVSPDSVVVPNLGKLPSYSFLSPTHSGSQNPILMFEYSGKYKICLKAWNNVDTSYICKDKYIEVKPSHQMCFPIFSDVQRAASGILYDDGGPQTNYQGGYNGANICNFALTPCTDKVIFTLSEFNVSTGDYLRIYDGGDNNGIPLWDIANLPNGMGNNMDMASQYFDTTFVAESGAMFFEWVTDGTSTSTTVGPGFVGSWVSVQGSYTPPTAKFIGPDTVCVGEVVHFENISVSSDTLYAWDFDNDNFTDAQTKDGEWQYVWMPWSNPVPVTLTVSDCGGSTTYTKNVTVIQPSQAPIADFTANTRKAVKAVDVVELTDLSYRCVDEWQWTITPGTYTVFNKMTDQNPMVMFNDTGCYDVTLEAKYTDDMFQTHVGTKSKSDYICVIEYCNPTVTYLNNDIGIGRVILEDIDNTTVIGASAYTDYTQSKFTYLDKKGTYDLTVERNSTFNAMNRKVWIDWNVDGDFEDAGELIDSEPSASTLSWTTTITVPLNVPNGPTRMRIATSLGSMTNNACGNRLYGEVEDYKVIIRPDATPPVISLNAGSDTINQCECPFIDAGATAVDLIDGTVPVTVKSNNVNCSLDGIYSIVYKAVDLSGNIAEETRTVTILKEVVEPEITINGNTNYYVEVYNSFTEPTYTAIDTCSGIDQVSVSSNVNTNEIGVYHVDYHATDKNGNENVVTVEVEVGDTTDPYISLIGYPVTTVEVFNPYKDFGYNVSDNYCDSIDIKVAMVSNLNINVVGSYVIDYKATDCNNNGPAMVSRVVNVVDTKAPTVTGPYTTGATIDIDVFTTFDLPDLNIKDNYDKNPSVTVSGSFYSTFDSPYGYADKLGTYDLTMTVTDASGNSTDYTLTINVVDNEPPVITIVGASLIQLERFALLTPDQNKVTVSDNYWPLTEADVVSSGTYNDIYVPKRGIGFYTIRYNLTDGSGNTADEKVKYIEIIETSDIEGSSNDKSIKIYPNPTTGIFNLDIELTKATDVDVEVVNPLGQKVKTIQMRNSLTEAYTIDLSNESAGIYMVRILTGDDISIYKVNLAK